jgi:hypothetical protein
MHEWAQAALEDRDVRAIRLIQGVLGLTRRFPREAVLRAATTALTHDARRQAAKDRARECVCCDLPPIAADYTFRGLSNRQAHLIMPCLMARWRSLTELRDTFRGSKALLRALTPPDGPQSAACRRKLRHATRDAADMHRAALVRKKKRDPRNHLLGVYRCPRCGGFHVGHSKPAPIASDGAAA